MSTYIIIMTQSNIAVSIFNIYNSMIIINEHVFCDIRQIIMPLLLKDKYFKKGFIVGYYIHIYINIV